MNESVFKAYDIRGVYRTDFDENDAYQIGLAYTALRRLELAKEIITIVVAMDMRLSSPILKEKLIEGLLDGGLNVIDIDLAATPTFYFAVAHYGYDGGIMVSASHNPQEYNGFKLVREKAIPISGETGMYQLRDLVVSKKSVPAATRGNLEKKAGVLSDQVRHDLAFANITKIKPLKIVIDPANAMGILYFNELFKFVPGEIIKINWTLDGTFPAHEADPLKAENMQALGAKIKEVGADLGIATDGDGDRIFFADNTGMRLEPGITRAILCKLFLREKPGAKIAYDIRPGKITPDTIIENGGIPIITRVGHSLIKEQTLAQGAYFSGEASGHFFLNMPEGCYEVPLIVTLKILQELSESDLPFSEYIKPYQKYFHSGEINSRVVDVKATIQKVKDAYTDGQQSEIDGISVEYPDWWFNVRGSNTEPVIRATVEAKSQTLMEKKTAELLQLIQA